MRIDYDERMKRLPFVVLADAASGHGAAYDHGHRLMVERVSVELMEFALNRHVHRAMWDEERDRVFPREIPAWLQGSDRSNWMLYWLRRGDSTQEHLQATPLN